MTTPRFLLLITAIIFAFCIYKVVETEIEHGLIYDSYSNDNWGTSTARDTIDREYKVAVSKEFLYIEELVPRSIFFDHFLKDTTIDRIQFKIINAGFRSNEYWGALAGADSTTTVFGDDVESVYIQAYSGMVRLVFNFRNKRGEETYYFTPVK